MPKIDLDTLPEQTGSSYPAPHDAAMKGRSSRRLAVAGGLTQFGANLVRLAPGAMSSLRHWHEKQDEFVMVTEGTLVLVEDDGETELQAGDCAAFPAGNPNGHHLVNRSDADGVFLVIGTHTETETGWYSDLDMKIEVNRGQMTFLRRDGSALDGTPAAAQPLEELFEAISAKLTQALIGGEYESYRAVFHSPASVFPRHGDGYMLTTEAEFREDFDLYLAATRDSGIDQIIRKIVRVTELEPDAFVVEAEVHFLKDGAALVTPFITTFRLERRAGEWRIARIISSLGHITWTRGEAGIGQDMKFELD
ncbi:cupin domain-containing protein [Sagittula sp. S175]|uniref:cupin domain-containing protein n=1 Tax=Sagittula sp. S175 TaxID=3415129 RepID=UPI003C7DB817